MCPFCFKQFRFLITSLNFVKKQSTMAFYQFGISNPQQQYIQIKATFQVNSELSEIQLPSWRPGRYELSDFSKNVKGFKVFNQDNKKVDFQKTTKDKWQLNTAESTSITVEYNYYANILNAGSTFLDATQLYVNPVNCCVYLIGQENQACEVELDIPLEWKVACSMKKNGKRLLAVNFDELADSPFICSAGLKYNQYESHGTVFHVWFNGEVKPDWSRLIKDFKAFTDKQIEKFNEFPCSDYHFLIHILPYKAYHGVEHCKSTVISLGPSYEVFKNLYKELLGVSSHELYHTWNVKAIRPIEMFPYDFTKENYSKMGYLCEGVTTYMGDLFLYKSKVFDKKAYFAELIARFQTHFDNHARFNYSVAESSFDTWLDGYEAGAPNRKVSIYTEGSLIAFVLDVMILEATKNKKSLDNVMKSLYFNYALKGKGVSEQDYKNELENVAGISFDEFFDLYVYGTNPFESIITHALEYLGLELTSVPSKIYSHARLGMKCLNDNGKTIAKVFYPGGPADLSGMMIDDHILAINGVSIQGELDEWLHYFDNDVKTFTIIRAHQVIELVIPEVNRNFYSQYGIAVMKAKDLTILHKNAFDAWSK